MSRSTPWARAVARSLCVAALVGTALFLVNHGDHLRRLPCCPGFAWKVAVSYLVPFTVSLATSILAYGDLRRRHQLTDPRSFEP